MRINSDSVLIEQAYLLILYNINNWLYETKEKQLTLLPEHLT